MVIIPPSIHTPQYNSHAHKQINNSDKIPKTRVCNKPLNRYLGFTIAVLSLWLCNFNESRLIPLILQYLFSGVYIRSNFSSLNMFRLRRSAISSVRSGLSCALKSEKGLVFSSSASEITEVEHSAKRFSTTLKSDIKRLASAGSKQITNGISAPFRGQCIRGYVVNFRLPFQQMDSRVANPKNYCSARSFASKASRQGTETSSESKKDISTVEDPFDAPTYNIPEKPVTFAEGASYSLIILAGLGVAAAAAYAVFKELIFEPKEYKIFNKALKRIQNDGQVRVRIGSPITGYGQESRNRAARQRIPNRVYTDEFGIEHVEVNFYIRGPHGAGKVFTEMFKDKEDKQWKFTYLVVEITSPSKAQLMLESYIPSAPA